MRMVRRYNEDLQNFNTFVSIYLFFGVQIIEYGHLIKKTVVRYKKFIIRLE